MRNMFRLDGFLIALQFFTIVPVKKQLALDKLRLKKAMQFFPFLGLALGGLMACVIAAGQSLTPISAPALALFVLTMSVFFSGGIHLDGWMDASDAFFSYRDKEKRLVIMNDPRAGSFAVLSLFLLLAWRYLFMMEMIDGSTLTTLVLIALIPCYARLAMALVFLFTPLAKQEGLAAFFKEGLEKKDVSFHAGSMAVLFAGIGFLNAGALIYAGLLLVATLLFAFFSKRFIERQFGGVTGDTLGATVEGVETGLWLILWLLR